MTSFWMAWMMFWIVPCPVKAWDSKKMKEMLLWLPGIGLLIGGGWTALSLGVEWLGSPLALKVLLGAFPWIVTGFIHLDGYLDCADAVLSFRDGEERLRILKDPHVGSFAVVMMALLALTNGAGAAAMEPEGHRLALLLIPAVSRAAAVLCVLSLPPLKTSSYAAMHAEGIGRGYVLAAAGELLVLLTAGFLFAGRDGWVLFYEAVSALLTAAKVRKNLGGMSGDISGCAITVAETCALAALSFM